MTRFLACLSRRVRIYTAGLSMFDFSIRSSSSPRAVGHIPFVSDILSMTAFLFDSRSVTLLTKRHAVFPVRFQWEVQGLSLNLETDCRHVRVTVF